MSETPTIVETARGPVEVLDEGKGPATICLHGAMGGVDQSRMLARVIGPAGYRYLSVSRPGYLGTPLTSGRTPDEQADLCAALLDAFDLARATVMAVSGGGAAAIQFAVRHAPRCAALVLVSTPSGKLDARIPAAFKLMMRLARWPWFVDKMRAKAARDPERSAHQSIADPAVRARLLADPEAGPLFFENTWSIFDRMARRIDGTRTDIESSAHTEFALEEIEAPTLVIHGTADKIVSYEEHAKRFAARIPSVRLLTIENGEHVAIFTHRDVVRAEVAEFLREHAPAAAA